GWRGPTAGATSGGRRWIRWRVPGRACGWRPGARVRAGCRDGCAGCAALRRNRTIRAWSCAGRTLGPCVTDASPAYDNHAKIERQTPDTAGIFHRQKFNLTLTVRADPVTVPSRTHAHPGPIVPQTTPTQAFELIARG